MDPHSRLSQFNQRGPKAGPNIVHNRQMEMRISRETLENFAKKAASAPSTRESTPFTSRPIATNSRVRKDEKYRKDMYLAFVNNALQQKKQGKGEPFEELVNQFNPKKLASDPITATTQLRLWISALSHIISQLDRPHAALVEAIVSLPWTTMDAAFAKPYISFLGMLVSARPEYAHRVLEKTIQGLTHQSGLQALNTGLPECSTNPLTRREVYERLHSLLQQLLSLIPTLPNTLQPILTRYFPHKRQSHVAQVTYIRNLLQISEYCPELSDGILALIVDRTIQIDVEIQVELEELEEAPEDGREMFPIDLFDNVVGQDGDESDSDSDLDPDDDGLGGLSDVSSDAGSDGEGGHADLPADVKRVQDMVAKLDSILTVVFDYFNRTHTAITPPLQSSSSPPDQPSSDVGPADAFRAPSPISVERASALRRARFNALLAIFDRTILRTFKSRYTQFLIFWYSSLDPEFADTFQGFLAQRALVDTATPTVTRAAAASYIASYVSRAQFVGLESARAVVSLLCRFLSNHLDVHDAVVGVESNQSQSAIQHAIFYAAAQALFLIFCFRWRDLIENDDNDEEELGASPSRRKWMPQLDVVQRVVSSPLNPLKVCSTNVVQQFARVAQHVGFVYVYSIIEANRRSDYLMASSVTSPSIPSDKTVQTQAHPGTRHSAATSSQMDADLTMFFPFDPYKLPKSSSYIQGVYREWSSVAIEDEDEDEDVDEDEEEGENYADESLGAPISSSYDMRDDTGGLGQSFGGMSISPIRPRQLTLAK
ncbi:RNA polymerase I-specific transcription initiation factor RRN3 [Rickenella mellea]|uniref:RNA polymerase I-specific transcription initiation factor RRN3 n=1 Tax=Rickenella mellea TaxID=50990 RepID=A0A4R5XF87_9AGAM|nr:RNA polymerase I-specific transcription initiation factor RRN3 [Rickenella mellea]